MFNCWREKKLLNASRRSQTTKEPPLRAGLLILSCISCLTGVPHTAIADAPPSVSLAIPAENPASLPDNKTSPEPSGAALPSAAVPSVVEDPWAVTFDLLPDAVRLRWKPIPGAIRYMVEMAPDSTLLRRLWIGTVEVPEALAPLHGFVPNGPVYVRLSAVNPNGETVNATVRSSLLGRQTDLPGGISGITVTTQQAAPPPAPLPRRYMKWQRPVLHREMTLISGRFGRENYSNYLLSHGLDFSGDSPAASVSTGARLLYTNNDREGLSVERGDVNLSTYLYVGMKEIPAHFSYNGYLYRPIRGGSSQSVHNFGMGYRVSDKLMTGAQITPDPRFMSLWGSWALGTGHLLFQFINSEFSRSVTLTYQTQQVLR